MKYSNMNAFWAFLIVLVVAVFIFVILPTLFTTPMTYNRRPYVPPSTSVPVPVKTPCQEEAEKSQAALNTFYENARDVVPEDYPRKLIGECPYSKPPSTSLPLANTPMCITAREHLRI